MSKRKKKEVVEDKAQISFLTEISPVQNLTIEQDTFIHVDTKDSILLAACAGSGKTFSCVKRLTTLLERGVDPKKIIFFSFTKAAADELTTRINRDDVEIRTIHSFCQKLLVRMGKFKDIATIP